MSLQSTQVPTCPTRPPHAARWHCHRSTSDYPQAGVVIAAVRSPGQLRGFAVSDGTPAQSDGIVAGLPGSPYTLVSDDRRGAVFVDVLLPARAPQLAAQPGPAGCDPPTQQHQLQQGGGAARLTVCVFQWSWSARDGGRLVPCGIVDAPTDTPTALRPLAVLPPAPGHHTSFLVVPGM